MKLADEIYFNADIRKKVLMALFIDVFSTKVLCLKFQFGEVTNLKC